ncbi:hypothetical protein B0H10DRAFT_2225004 [Mycena sp. CBHHK59/15]|nr:hypothetical protein B0H10DRAFT_2225004 [Mycena sp. CBHHK59/15]
MHFTKALVALVASAFTAVSAIPVSDQTKVTLGWEIVVAPTSPNVPRALAGRTPGGVFICTDINFSGTCGYAVQPLDVCIFLTSPWYRTISSFGPDPGATCFAYSQNSCNEAQWEFTYPGDATGGLGTSDPWNDQARLFKSCESRTDPPFQISNFMCE